MELNEEIPIGVAEIESEVAIGVAEIKSEVLGVCVVRTIARRAWTGLVLAKEKVCLGTDKPCRQLAPF